MKKFLIITPLFLFLAINAQTIKTIKPKPVKAVVYLSGAEIAYLETITIGAGTTELIVEGVSPYTDPNSISAFFKGGLVIDNKKSVRYPDPPKLFDAESKYAFVISRITDSLEELDFVLKDCNNKYAALEKEKSLLLNNRLIRGEFTKDSLNLLKAALDLLRTRLNNIDEEELSIERKLAKHYKLQAKLTTRKNYYEEMQKNLVPVLNFDQYQPVHQIVITIEAESAVTGSFSLKYYVAQAGWLPMYDIQATSGKEKIQLVYRAQVYQNTGLDWKDVALVLSTSNPTVGNTKPTMTAWNLSFGYPDSYLEKMNSKKVPSYNNNLNMYSKDLKQEDVTLTESESKAGAQVPAQPVFTVSDNFLRTEYEIKTKYSIRSDNKAHNVIINNLEIPVTLAYLSVPKLDKDAFLMGKVANWEDLNLIPATAKIYFDDSYIGLTAIDPVSTRDTLYVNMGRDKSIVVKRLAVKEKCKETVIGDFRVLSKTIEITVRNTKGINLDFEIEDQIPVSADNAIKITMINNDRAIYNEASGKLVWKLNIRSKDTEKVTFSYEIKYPKDKFIAGL